MDKTNLCQDTPLPSDPAEKKMMNGSLRPVDWIGPKEKENEYE